MSTEIRFAFAMNGGVSLAIWIGGVADEVLRFVEGGRRAALGEHDAANPWVALCRDLDVVPKVDVLAGSSAGGLNAAFLGAAVVHGCPNLEAIRQLWLDHGSFDRLLRPPNDRAPVSVLDGDRNFLPHIEEAFRLLAKNGTGFADVDPPVTVRLTATSLAGRVTTISDGHGEICSVDHRAEFVFRTPDFDFDAHDRVVARLARACRSTASFPGAFEPSDVPVDLYEARHVSGGLFDGVTAATVPVIDGAVLVNLPARSAIEAIIAQPSRERTERVLALVVPDPGELQVADGGSLPTLNEVLSKSIVGIPRTQSLTDFVRELNEHNAEVRSRRAARDSMLAQFAAVDPAAAWADLANVGEALFPAYQATRVVTSLDRLRVGLPARLPAGLPPVDLTVLEQSDPDLLPWISNELAPGGDEWCWGSAPVQRLAAVLITWINAVARMAPAGLDRSIYAVKDRISAIRVEAERLSPPTEEFELVLAEEIARAGGDVAVAFERACRRWPSDDPAEAAGAIAALNDQVHALAGCLTGFMAQARATIEQPPSPFAGTVQAAALLGLLRLHDGAAATPGGVVRLLLCIEVIEATFSGTEPRPDQEIRLVQFSSKGTVTIDRLQRSASVDKLAGVELAHFGAFLKRSWRANDWMWGRLDSAERLLVLLDAMLGHPLSEAGTLEARTRAVQTEILRQELPTIVGEIEADIALGARSSEESKAFVAAVREMSGTPQGPVDLADMTQDQLEELFTRQLVGSENLEKEVGSNLATITSIGALATAAGVLRAQGPRVIRAPVRVFGASTSVAWRIARRRRGRRLRVLEGLLAVILAVVGVVGAVLDLFTGLHLGPTRWFAWLCLLLAPVLAVFAAPWLLLGIGRKVMSKPRAH